MPTPVLIDTDMGVDDAVAVTLACCTSDIDIVGLASVGGNVSLEQATVNIARLLAGLNLDTVPPIARGFEPPRDDLEDTTHVLGADGLGEIDLAVPGHVEPCDCLALYEELIETHGEDLAIIAIGPLTNLAAVLAQRPELLQKVGQIIVMGGAVWCPGNVTPHAEFNFYRDADAASAVLAAGLPITVVPLDVTAQVVIDESHTAHLSCSGTRSGELLARMIRFPLERPHDGGSGRFIPHDALAMGVLIWPEMFMRSKMALDIVTAGEHMGQCKPKVAKDARRKLNVVISVNVVDFLDNLLEQLCHEKFVV